MIDREIIRAIISSGTLAPSGDNSQPWYFHVSGDAIFVFQIPDKDNPFLNYHLSGTHVAIGAVIENICIAATAYAIAAQVKLFPGEPDCVAKIDLVQNNTERDPLVDAIPLRHTNRKNYEQTFLPDDLKAHILTEANVEQGVRAVISEGSAMKKLGHAGSRAEVAILENRELHQLLFGNVVWTKAEEAAKREGLFVDTLEFAPPQKFFFRLCGNWKIMSFLNKLGFAKFVSNDNAKKYGTGAAFIAIVTSHNSPEDFVKAGRAMERVWLLLNQAGYAVHPITATLFFGQRILEGKEEGLTRDSWELMENAFHSIKTILNVQTEHIAFMFRTGKTSAPSARSSKKPPVIEFDNIY
jgi:nitroreductase